MSCESEFAVIAPEALLHPPSIYPPRLDEGKGHIAPCSKLGQDLLYTGEREDTREMHGGFFPARRVNKRRGYSQG